MRLLFAALVLLSHAPELVDGDRGRELFWRLTHGTRSFGEFAVSGFFALSGFLIMSSWIRNPALSTYFRNRVLRIYPGFIVAFCISVLIVGPIAAGPAPYFEQFTKFRFFFSLFTLREPWFAESFPTLHYHSVNGALWTISYEFACYVAVAVVAVLARGQFKSVWLILTALLSIVACLIPDLEPLPQINRFYVSALVEMSAIFFAGAAYRLAGFDGFRRPGLLVLTGLLFAASCFSRRYDIVGFAVFGSAFFISIGLSTSRLAATLRIPDVSYGTYLYGWPILELLIWSFPRSDAWSIFGMSLLLSLLCGYVSWKLVEAPFLRLKRRHPGLPVGAIAAPHAK